jgi:hypothetical protein
MSTFILLLFLTCLLVYGGVDHQKFREIRTLYAGSENWIVKYEKIQNWRHMDTPVSSILWVNGIPGAGMLPTSPMVRFNRCRE